MSNILITEEIHKYCSDISIGDIDALSKLYDLLSMRVYNYALTMTKNKQDAEDITHDVFLQIIKHSSRLAKIQNPVSYIMVATRNISYNFCKHNSRKTLPLDEINDIEAHKSESPLLIESALFNLPDKMREIIYLHHICGFTQKEVSKIMNVPLPTVKWRCRKALLLLKEYLKND